MNKTHKMLSIFIDKTDRWKDSNLYEAIVYTLERNGIAGVTVLNGIMGYGIHRRVHREGLFGVSDEEPIVIIVVDQEKSLRKVLPTLLPMVQEGLITMQDVEVIALQKEAGV